jgi:hypothetical protein
MSVIIQGLKLPAYQGEHKEFDRYGCFLTVYKTGKVELHIFEKDFDVKDIPTPHGRLIDADELIGYLNEWLSDSVALSGFTRIINHQPTIIKAEGVNENS